MRGLETSQKKEWLFESSQEALVWGGAKQVLEGNRAVRAQEFAENQRVCPVQNSEAVQKSYAEAPYQNKQAIAVRKTALTHLCVTVSIIQTEMSFMFILYCDLK